MSGLATLYERIESLAEQSRDALPTDPRRALRLAEDALTLLGDADDFRDTLPYRLHRIHCLRAVGQAHERLSDYPEALRYGKESLTLAEGSMTLATDPEERDAVLEVIANACSLLGNTCDRLADFVGSLRYRRRNMEIAGLRANRADRGYALLQLAATYYRLADYPTTLDCYRQALEIFQESGDGVGVGSAWNGIGNVHFSQDNFGASAEAYEKGLEAFNALPEPYWQAGLLGNVAGAYLELDRLEEAREAALRSLVLRARIGDRHGQGYAHDALARIYLKMGRPPKAREAALRSLSLFEEVNDRTGVVYANRTLGRTCVEIGDYKAALRHYTNAMTAAQAVGLREPLYHTYELVSQLYEKLGDTTAALEYYKKFHNERTALFNEERDHRLNNLRALHEVEQARREAEVARRYSRDLEDANRRQGELLARLQEQSVELERQARTDALTGLYNRRHFETLFAEAFAHARETGEPLAVALLDVDLFKEINDHYMHEVGDAVLRGLGRILKTHCRTGEIAARYGGEEFVLALSGVSREEALARCESLRAAIESASWLPLPEGHQVTVSIGVCAETDVPHRDRMLSLADTRLYEAKNAGRNRVQG